MLSCQRTSSTDADALSPCCLGQTLHTTANFVIQIKNKATHIGRKLKYSSVIHFLYFDPPQRFSKTFPAPHSVIQMQKLQNLKILNLYRQGGQVGNSGVSGNGNIFEHEE